MKNKIKTTKGKKVLSFVLAAIMLATTFNIALPELKLNASAVDLPRDAEGNVVLDGITQKRVVSNYEATYATYANRFFGGEGKSEPTNFVIPGLSSTDDYTPQGMTYWKAKDWILISAYDASGAGEHSVIYALDGKSTEFVALFKVLNADGSVNTSHGGGIAASEYNFYYADTGSKISYVPLSEMDVAEGTVKNITLQGSIDCSAEMNGAYTSYCCYDEGVLWTGNFYFDSTSYDYAQKANDTYNSMLFGYKLIGNSSDEEWAYLSGKYKNRLNVGTSSGTVKAYIDTDGSGEIDDSEKNDDNINATCTWNAYKSGDYVDIMGSISAPTSEVGEFCPSFGSFELTEGKNYIIQYTTNVNPDSCDFYMFAPNGGGHMDVKQAKDRKVTQLEDGRWHVSLEFTAGLKPTGADSSWPTTQSTNGTYTGDYTIRFDQDTIQAGESRDFAFTDVSITEASDHLLDLNNENRLGYRGNHAGVVGNPTYCVAFDNSIDRIQYAMVDNGRIYISRSWSRNDSGNHIRQLAVGEIDLNARGTKQLDINGRTRSCQFVELNDNFKTFGGTYKNPSTSTEEKNKMFFMGEALCVMEGYLYMFAESAAWTYNGKDSSSVCPEPIDVIWKIDQYAIMGELRETDNEKLNHYELVTDRDKQITNTDNPLLNTDEYIIVYESSQKDPVTQKNILYALDAFGGNTGTKLPKNSNGDFSENSNGYTIGIVGHPITEYNIQDGKLYLTNPEKDDIENIRWKFSDASTDEAFRFYEIQSVAPYYSKYKELFFSGKKVFMSPEAKEVRLGVQPATDKQWYITIGKDRFLWCNDGTRGFEDEINKFYKTDLNTSVFVEQAGTFHTDATTSDNVVGRDIGAENYDLGQFYIYKRILDPNAEKENSKVYTNSTAELQSDGTYTINMETYAIAPTHYTLLDEQRPTDFIFVLDTSGSMSTQDCNGYHRHDSFDLEAASNTTAGGASSKTSNDVNSGTYGDYEPERMWIQHSDGVMCPVGVRAQGDGVDKNWIGAVTTRYQRIYLWYTHPTTGEKYWFHPTNSESVTGTWTTTPTTHDEALRINGNDQATRYGSNVFSGICYEKRSDASRLSNLQIAVNQLTYKIQNEAKETGFDHRIALVQYGSNSSGSWTNMGMYTNDSTSMVSYTGAGTVSDLNYQKAFHTVSQFDNVRTIINNLSASGDTYVDYGMDMAYNIIKQAKNADNCTGYLANGNRSACILMITDGCPGVGGDNSTEANKSANAAIANAQLAKSAGAYVFTVQMGNNSMSGFDMSAYMDYTSSEYVDSQSMSSPGERNNNEVNYRMDVDAGSSFNLDSFVSSMFTNVTANSRMALTQLSTDSILRQTLSDKFYAPVNGAKVEYLFADGYYDGLGRLAFRNETDATQSGVTGTPTTATDSEGNEYYKYLDVTGFDYKNYYISKTHEGGKKLIIRITGVLPRTTSVTDGSELSHINSAISDDSWTGIYQTEEMLKNKQEFKGFPNETFTIPEYTYVLDYGLHMLDTDVNGTLKSVSADLSAQRDEDGNISYKTVSENGLVEIQEGAQNLLYYSTPTNTTDSGYVLIQRDSGKYDWFEIKVVPASNVYYEESNITTTTANYVDWNEISNNSTVYQDLSTEDDVYGYDSAYEGSTGFSNGSYYKAVVKSTSTATRMSDTATFTFTGTSFDLIGACGTNTGIQAIKVKDSSGNLLNSYIIDTYLSDESIMTEGVDGLLLHQVPILSYRTTTYDTYTVEVTAAYLSFAQALTGTAAVSYASAPVVAGNGVEISATTSTASDTLLEELENMGIVDSNENVEVVWMDDNSIFNGGTGATDVATAVPKNGILSGFARQYFSSSVTSLANYIDGFRIYNPMNGGYEDYIDSEQNATYYNIVEEIGTTNSDNFEIIGSDSAVNFNFSKGFDYDSFRTNGGPKGEIYLQPGQALAFTFTASTDGTPSNVMLGMRAVNGSTQASICTTNNINSPYPVSVNSATEMYYDVSEAGTVNGGVVTMAVQNTGSKVLAVNNLKLVDGTLTSSGTADDSGSATAVGGTASVPTPVVPTLDATQDDANADTTAPETDVDTTTPETDVDAEASLPENDAEADVEDNTEEDADNSVTAMFPGMPVSIASFLELLFEFLGQLVGSLEF